MSSEEKSQIVYSLITVLETFIWRVDRHEFSIIMDPKGNSRECGLNLHFSANQQTLWNRIVAYVLAWGLQKQRPWGKMKTKMLHFESIAVLAGAD